MKFISSLKMLSVNFFNIPFLIGKTIVAVNVKNGKCVNQKDLFFQSDSQ